MTKAEFLKSVPDIIEHNAWAYGELEIITDNSSQKSVCYRHKDKTASFGTHGIDWLDVHDQLRTNLLKLGYISN